MATYGFATGSNLTDLGRNLVAQETTRNALTAALAAAAAQQGVARTQAGASRYSTDAQREGNQLMAMLRGLENDRLRQATEMEAGLKGRDLTLRDTLGRLQFGQNTPEAMMAERAHEIEIAKIAAEAQKAVNQRPHYQIERERLAQEQEDGAFNSLIEPTLARANALSDKLYKEVVEDRGNFMGLGKSIEKVTELYSNRAQAEIPPMLGELGPYVIPQVVGGRVRFTVRRRGQSALPLPTPPLSVDEVESALGGSTVPAVPLMRAPTVPRGTNDVPTLPMLPVAQDTEPGFFSKLSGLTDRSPIAQLAQLIGRSSVRTPDAPVTPVAPLSAAPPIVSLAETIRQQSPLTELVPIIDFDPGRTSRTSPNSAGEAESIVLGYIDNLAKEIQRLNQLPAQRGTESRKALVIKELSRLRQLMPGLN